MGTLKTYYSEKITMWIRNCNQTLDIFDIIEYFGKAYANVQTADWFRATVICPLNENALSDVDAIVAEVVAAMACNAPTSERVERP
jgi:hypothetical protein